MKVVFISNYLNHHQLPVCKEFIANSVDFTFIATTPVPKVRIDFGYQDMNKEYDFVLPVYEGNIDKAIKLCSDADIVIVGHAPYMFIKERLKQKKLTFCYSERIYKQKRRYLLLPLYAIKQFFKNGIHRNFYLLCASSYAYGDFAKTLAFIGKGYKWGYFPEVKEYENIETLINGKEKNSILWAGRLFSFKHPELAIETASRLKQNGFDFHLKIIGNGPMEAKLRKMIKDYGLEEYVSLLGQMSPQEVRKYMEKSEIFLFTSDRNEGWGAVLNEAMNSGCAVVAGDKIGSVGFLIKNGQNGYVFKNRNKKSLYKSVEKLLVSEEKRIIGKNAYKTVLEEWSAKTAVKNFLILSENLQNGLKNGNITEGPCSKVK